MREMENIWDNSRMVANMCAYSDVVDISQDTVLYINILAVCVLPYDREGTTAQLLSANQVKQHAQ